MLAMLLSTTSTRPFVGRQRNLIYSAFHKLMDVTTAYDSCTLTRLFCTSHVLQGKVKKNLQLQLRQLVTISSYLSIPPGYLSGTSVAFS